MKSTSIPRQLSALSWVLAIFGCVAAAIFFLMLIRAYDESARASATGAAELTRVYTILERVSSGQDALQRLVRTKDADKLEAGIADIEANRERVAQIIGALGDRGMAIGAQYEKAVAVEKQVMDAVLKGDIGAANERFMEAASPSYESVKAAVRDYFAVAQQLTATAIEAQASRARTQLVVCLLLGALAIGGLFAYVWRLRQGIASRLSALSTTLMESGAQLGDTAAQVTASSQLVSEGVNRQAAALEETSASLEEIGATASQNAGHAQQAKELATEARTAAESGHGDMGDMIEAMDAIKASSGAIAGIIKTIDEIAFQTNLLALNAAVEAARAGQAGLGFAVVADEVRALAQRSATAARETASSVEQVIEKSNRGVEVSGKVARSLEDIVARARRVDALVAQIATASDQQRSGIEQVSTALGDIEKVTQEGAASAEETATTVQELNAQTDSLRRVVDELQRLTGMEEAEGAGRQAAMHREVRPSAHRAA